MDYYESLEIVRLVVTGLVTAGSAALFALIFRKPGVRDDYTRRWVNFTKAAIGLWSGARFFDFIISIIYFATRGPQWGRPVAWDAASFLGAISMYLDSFAQVSIFLALIYLAHALTQLRTDSDEKSEGYRGGQKVALAAAALGLLLSVAVNTVYLAGYIMQIASRNDYSYRSWDATYRLFNAARIVALTEVCYFAVCGIGAAVYAVKARSKARGTPVRRAGSYLVAAAGMWLTRHLWWIIYSVTVVYDYLRVTAIIDLFTNLCMILAVFVLLFMMASQPRFSLARTLYKRPDGPERVL